MVHHEEGTEVAELGSADRTADAGSCALGLFNRLEGFGDSSGDGHVCGDVEDRGVSEEGGGGGGGGSDEVGGSAVDSGKNARANNEFQNFKLGPEGGRVGGKGSDEQSDSEDEYG